MRLQDGFARKAHGVALGFLIGRIGFAKGCDRRNAAPGVGGFIRNCKFCVFSA